jgi:subfamily B ATP-binding cassette protein MsbA
MAVTIYRRMLRYVRPYAARLAFAMVCMIVVSSFRGAIAFLVKPALDDIFINKDAGRLKVIPLLVLGVYLLKGAFEFAQGYLMSGVGQRVIRDIRDHLYRHMQSLSLSFYMKHPTGVLMSRVTNDVGLMQGAVTEAVTGLIKDAFSALFLVGVIFYRDWKLEGSFAGRASGPRRSRGGCPRTSRRPSAGRSWSSRSAPRNTRWTGSPPGTPTCSA